MDGWSNLAYLVDIRPTWCKTSSLGGYLAHLVDIWLTLWIPGSHHEKRFTWWLPGSLGRHLAHLVHYYPLLCVSGRQLKLILHMFKFFKWTAGGCGAHVYQVYKTVTIVSAVYWCTSVYRLWGIKPNKGVDIFRANSFMETKWEKTYINIENKT